MAQLKYGDSTLNFGDDNKTVAILQVATARRFATGKGYFITAAAADDDGNETNTGHWISPATPLRFVYDVEDAYGNPAETVMIEEDDVVPYLEAMDWPIGVRFGYSAARGRYLPFADEAMRQAAESAPSAGELAEEADS
ncbi:hypothetical protein [Mycolicibacterium llatzerense]|uniref:DUF7882 domain-containing protein n=1 Tax=Mycolicibacterium llatzerense TaxID=280871 RepID=A0A0D1K093_9MYCO|nr:hypothetical protein [Mycolicibacterium llatzerense]KIU18334.1 hypothetical protein TL10_02510 [Mycolicibacterium llatzerense]